MHISGKGKVDCRDKTMLLHRQSDIGECDLRHMDVRATVTMAAIVCVCVCASSVVHMNPSQLLRYRVEKLLQTSSIHLLPSLTGIVI